MKLLTPITAIIALILAAPALHAQIVWSLEGPQTITGVNDVVTDGSFVDALQTHLTDPSANTAVTPETVTNAMTNVSVTFGVYNPTTQQDSYFNFDGAAGYGGAGQGNTASADYNEILDGCTFYEPGPGTFTLGGLKEGHTYELEIWDSATWATTITDTNSVTLNGDQWVTGEIVVPGTDSSITTTQTISFGAAAGSGSLYGTIDAVELRDVTVPEPSTYAMLFAGVGALVLVARLRRVA
jgi:hypothetical protein